MNKDDVKEIKNIIDTALETHLGSLHEEISDLRTEVKKGSVGARRTPERQD